MINIFYQDNHLGSRMSGPKKVINNLIRSLEDCEIEFSLNQETYDNNFFLHWDNYHLSVYKSLKNKNNLLVGPQFWPFAPEANQLEEYGKIIVPSKWVGDLYEKFFEFRGILQWPVAIYPPTLNESITTDCLIYYKNRSEQDLQHVLDFFEQKNISYVGLEYGNYTQEEFVECLESVRFCVIIDNTESQGIAIQEMMAVNKPLLVWDQPIWDHMGSQYAVPATSIPYWSDECGERFLLKDEFEDTFEKFYSNLDNYNPQKFVQENLSPQKSVQILLDYYAN